MNREEIFNKVEEKIRNEELTTREELVAYLTELKDRGILTKGQIDARLEELWEELNGGVTSSKTGTRTPKTMEYAYSNVSAGFSSTGMLMLLATSVPALVGMINLLNK